MPTQQLKYITFVMIGTICVLLIIFYQSYYFSSSARTEARYPIYTDVKSTIEVPQPFVVSRRSNLSVSATIASSAAPSLPSFVHQSWKNKDLPPRFIRWFATWEICFPSYEHRLWTDDDNLELVRQKAPDFLDQYIKYKDKIQRADAVRYFYMYHYGGIYSDLDNECLRSFQHLIDNSGCGIILGSMRYSAKKQYIQNSFMYSRRKHPFWLKVVEAMKERSGIVGSFPQNTVDLTTGPQLLMHSVKQHRTTYEGTQNPGPICVFPDTFFNPYSWDIDKSGPCKDLNKMTETDLANCKMKHKKAYVIQYHTQSWYSGKV